MSRENPGQNKQKLTREQRCAQTKQRNAIRREKMKEKLSKRPEVDPFTQLKRLDERLGKNVGARKERKRLAEFISNAIVK